MIALWWVGSALGQGTVTVPLDTWQQQRDAAAATAPVSPRAPTVGAAVWRGTARDTDAASIEIAGTLRVDLGDAPGWKSVPLLGRGAVLTGITVDGRPATVGLSADHHTWRTERTGSAVVEVRGLIDAGGQGGALQIDFAVPETASTRLELDLPQPDLDPQVEDAVKTAVTSVGGRTRLVADLVPTSRIAVLGLKDLGDTSSRAAKLYAEGVHLLSVDEHRLELFTVLHYSILYAGARQFEAFLPEGLRVVSADGEGAFRYTLEDIDGGTLLHGETAYPIRNRYEISLRLQRELPTETFAIDLPHPIGVERVHGWVGVEVPGRVQLDTVDAKDLVSIDPLQLPDEVREASVSPILAAFRTTRDRGRVRLSARPLPEVEVDAETIDRVTARSLVSANGRVATELQLTLRNRLRHGLTLTLPEGTQVVRAQRDGVAVVPSRADDRRLVFPLRRTTASDALVLQVVLASEIAIPGWIGRTDLALPSVDLPISELSWQVHWPDGSNVSTLKSEVRSQERVGSGHWMGTAQGAQGSLAPSTLATPEGGRVVGYQRYWVPAEENIAVHGTHVARSLRAIGVLGIAALIFGLGAWGLSLGAGRIRHTASSLADALRKMKPAVPPRDPQSSGGSENP